MADPVVQPSKITDGTFFFLFDILTLIHFFSYEIIVRSSAFSFGHSGPIQSSVYLLFSFGTFDSFLSILDRYWVYGACCSAQTAHKSV